MKKLLLFVLTAGFIMLPVAAYPAEYRVASSKPALSQPLVREGDYAVKLVAALKLGKARDETTAEDVLAARGIAPRSGWMSGFPVTPDVASQVRTSVKIAAGRGKVRLSRKAADRSVVALNRRLGLES